MVNFRWVNYDFTLRHRGLNDNLIFLLFELFGCHRCERDVCYTLIWISELQHQVDVLALLLWFALPNAVDGHFGDVEVHLEIDSERILLGDVDVRDYHFLLTCLALLDTFR